MADLGDYAQKIKGEAQLAKGKLQDNMGDDTSGKWEQIKGAANEAIADMKLKADDMTTEEGYTDDVTSDDENV